MKNFVVVLTILLGININAFSQKTFTFTNYTGYTVEIGGIVTQDTINDLPNYDSSSSFGNISIPPNGSYILENSLNGQRFPFDSPNSTPYIDEWTKIDPPNAPITVNSTTAWSQGDDQIFYYVKFQVGTNGSLGGGTLGRIDSSLPTFVPGNGWNAYSLPSVNSQTYTIIIM